MTPSELKKYLQVRKQASLRDIALHFDSDVNTVKDAVSIWIRKGRVEQSTISGCEKGCCQCDPGLSTVFYWKGESN